MSINVKELKKGCILYAIPTGNNARYNGDKIYKFEFISAGRKYFKLKPEYGEAQNYCPKKGATQKSINTGYGHNAGYIFFTSIDDLNDYKFKEKRNEEIYRSFSSKYSLPSYLSEDTIQKIYEELKGSEIFNEQ